MENTLSSGVSIHEEELDGKKVFVAESAELGISDFGDTIDEALNNLRKAIRLLLEEAPEKKELLSTEKPVLVTRLNL
jgi:predicted RNase H-like HicB family nuclease